MDEYTEKRPASVFEFSNESSSLSFRDQKHEESNFHCFNSTECSTGPGSTKSTRNSSPVKIKYLKPPLRFKSSNPHAASSSLNLYFHEIQKRESLEETNSTEGSNREDEEGDALKFDFEVGGRKKKETDFSRGLKTTFVHSSPTILTKTSSNSEATSSSRHGDLPSGSSSDGHNKRSVPFRKKFHEGEGSSTGMLLLQQHQVPEGTSSTKGERNTRDVTVFGKTYPTFGGKSSRMRSQEVEGSLQPPESCLLPRQPHASLTIPEAVQERSQLPFVSQNTSFAGTQWSSSRRSRRRSVSRSEVRDDYLRLNMEGITEVLHALEMIEQDEELTYEQLMVLEENLLEGFSFYDQHRDMRLDIDSMSYEDLLALEEKIGYVSTAVPEGSLSSCFKKSTYKTSFLHMQGLIGHGDDDIKCSICQEEYLNGDEVGRLPCDHQYHMACIHQWLRLKNWCPICKVPPFLP